MFVTLFVGFLGNPDPFLGGGECIHNIAFAGWSFGGCTNPTIRIRAPETQLNMFFLTSISRGEINSGIPIYFRSFIGAPISPYFITADGPHRVPSGRKLRLMMLLWLQNSTLSYLARPSAFSVFKIGRSSQSQPKLESGAEMPPFQPTKILDAGYPESPK